ncbi:MAG: hypothetical protein LBH88_01145 [Candidatus Methanoplasma sp.]|nr:hypothetical protein [Candidatus Methanoplasma sp.]
MPDDVVELIWEALGEDRLTTKEASDRLDRLFGYRCPDDIAKTLSKLRRAGLVKGEISMEAGGWLWWTDGECRNNRAGEKD